VSSAWSALTLHWGSAENISYNIDKFFPEKLCCETKSSLFGVLEVVML